MINWLTDCASCMHYLFIYFFTICVPNTNPKNIKRKTKQIEAILLRAMHVASLGAAEDRIKIIKIYKWKTKTMKCCIKYIQSMQTHRSRGEHAKRFARQTEAGNSLEFGCPKPKTDLNTAQIEVCVSVFVFVFCHLKYNVELVCDVWCYSTVNTPKTRKEKRNTQNQNTYRITKDTVDGYRIAFQRHACDLCTRCACVVCMCECLRLCTSYETNEIGLWPHGKLNSL